MQAPCGHEGDHTGFGDFVTCKVKGCPGVAGVAPAEKPACGCGNGLCAICWRAGSRPRS